MLWEIDGQNLRLNRKKLLVIDDPRSPYHGMLAADYKTRVVKPWKITRAKIENRKLAIQRDLARRGRDDEFRAEFSRLMDDLYEKNPEWRDLFTLKLNGKPAMPAWPEGVKNHLQENVKKVHS
jgi:hypothetical protein